MNRQIILDGLNQVFPNPKCELIYNEDYELLIAVMLSAQSTDKRVNTVTKKLFAEYDLKGLANADIDDIKKIIAPVGMYHKKAFFVKSIASELLNYSEGKVPNNRDFLQRLPGVGRKTANVVLANLYDEPSFAVDTHVERVSKRLGIIKDENSNVLKIEKRLCKYFVRDSWNKVNDQMVLFGRYICKSRNPLCNKCPFNNVCKNR